MISPSRVRHVRIVFLVTTFSWLSFLVFFGTPSTLTSRVATSQHSRQVGAARSGQASGIERASGVFAAKDARVLNLPANAQNGGFQNNQSINPIANWKFDEAAGLTVVDSSGNGLNGTLQNGASWMVGRAGSSLNFDGVDDYVQVGAQPGLVMSSALTVSAWINPSGFGSGIVINKEGEYEVAVAGTVQMAFANSNPGWAWINTGYAPPLGQWTQLVVVYDNGVIKTYANGNLVHTYNGFGLIGDVDPGQNDFRIGGRQCCAQFFAGRIDEVRIYNRALSDQEVQDNVSSGVLPRIVPVAVTASNSYFGGPPSMAIDQNLGSSWNAGNYAPQWIQLDLGKTYAISMVRLYVNQVPDGQTIHEIYGGPAPDPTSLLRTLNGPTKAWQWLEPVFNPAVGGVRYLKIKTTSSPSWVAWFEIEVFGTLDTPPTVSLSSPVNNSQFELPATIEMDAIATASVGRSISKVEFYQNNNYIGQSVTALTGSTYRLNWNPTTAGSYVVTARVTDSSGVSTTSAPVNLTVSSWSGVNLALGRPAEQSSTGSWNGITGSAGLAVDGKTDGNFWNGSVTHTLYDNTPWWQVDVGNAEVRRIDIWNRTDCCSDHLADYYVFVSNQPFSPSDTSTSIISRGVWYQYLKTTATTPLSINVNQPGRYVRVQLAGPNYMHMAEVQVWGTALPSLSPLAYWKFDEEAAYQAADSSGNGNTGTLQNGPVWTTGKSINALNFDGLNDVVSVSGRPALTSAYNNFTISFWAQPLSAHQIDAEGTDIWAGVANQKYAIGPQHGAAAYGSSDHAGVGVSVGTNGVSVYEHCDAYMPATLVHSAALNGWTHILVVYENRQPRLYLNGTLVRTGVKSAKPYVHVVPDQIGGMGYGYFNGKLDDVRIYNRVLSQMEINLLYSSDSDCLPACPTHLKASPTSATQVNLTWEDNSVNESGFKIERYDSTNPYWIEVAVVAQNVTSFLDAGSSVATTPLYRIRAASAVGDSLYSNIASTTQQTCGQVQFARQTGGDKTSMIISWEPPEEGVPIGYLVRYRPLTDSDSQPIPMPPFGPTVTQIRIPDLAPGTGYFIEIQTICGPQETTSEWAIALGITDPEECERPRDLDVTGVTSDSAVVQWRKVDGAREYKVQVFIAGQAAQEPVFVRGNTKLIDHLMPSTDYEVRVNSVCSMDRQFNSPFSSKFFRTADAGPPPTDCPKPDNFKIVGINAAFARAKWNEVAATEKYPIINYYFEYKETDDPEGFILRPVIGLTEWLMHDLKPGTAHQARVRTLCVESDTRTFAWSEYTPIPPAQFDTPACEPPTGITAKEERYNSAKIQWEKPDFDELSEGYRWTIRYRNIGAGQSHDWFEETTDFKDNKTRIGAPSNPLVPDSPYEYQIITRCSNQYSSPASPLFNFRTQPCPVPEGLEAKNISVTTAKLTWVPAGDANDVRYRRFCKDCSDEQAPWQEVHNITDGAHTISGLSADTKYEFQVRSACAHVSPTAWSPSATFRTLNCTSAVPDLSISDITKHSALIHWSDIKGVTYYQYRYKQVGGDWVGPFDLLTNEQSIGGLETCTEYIVEVRSACTPLGAPTQTFSDWARKSFFTDGCTCESPMITHGDNCSELFIFVDLTPDFTGDHSFRLRWATKKFKGNAWRFEWRECSSFTNCSGNFASITSFNSFKEKSCLDVNRHFDYYIEPLVLRLGHFYEIRASYRCDNGAWSDPVGEVYKIVRVNNLTIVNLTATSATLRWEPVPEATGYVISYGTQDNEPAGDATVDAATNTFSLTGLDPNTAYDVEVKAILADGMSMPATETITTAIGGCRYIISPTSASAEAAGGSVTITVSADSGCAWTAVSNVPWITITTGSSGSGNGTVSYSVSANPGVDARTGTVTVGGYAVAITQSGISENPVPSITSISPDSAPAGSGPVTLAVNGAGFNSNSVVQVNGIDRATTFQGANLLSAVIPSSDMVSPFTLAITVTNPAPGGGRSNAVNFAVTSSNGCTRSSPTVTISPADQQGYRSQQLYYRVTVQNNDSAPCGITSFDVIPTFPASGWGQMPANPTFTVMAGESQSRDVLIWSAPMAPYAAHIIRETATSFVGHSASAQATYTVYSIAPPDTCGRANPTVTISPIEQRGYGGQQLTYRVFVTNNDNPQCGTSGFDVTPTFPGSGWGQSPTSMGFTILPGETVWRDAIVWSAPGAPFASHVFTETATSSSETYGSGQATYTVYDPLPPDTCGRANPTVTITPNYQDGTQAERLSYVLTVTNNDAPTCGGSSFVVRPTLPSVPSGFPWTHVPEDYFSIFALPGESASREINVISASLAQMGENIIVWTANHTRYNFGSGQAIFNVIPYELASLWKFPDPSEGCGEYLSRLCELTRRLGLGWLGSEPRLATRKESLIPDRPSLATSLVLRKWSEPERVAESPPVICNLPKEYVLRR